MGLYFVRVMIDWFNGKMFICLVLLKIIMKGSFVCEVEVNEW